MNENPSPGPSRSPSRSPYEKLIILGLILILAVPFSWLFNPPAFLQNNTPTIDVLKQIPDPSIGNPYAPIKIIEYGDFGCTKCRQWFQSGIRDQILAKYGDQVVFIWRDLPTVSSYTIRAAEAGQCANEQGKFWEYHDYLYGEPEGFTQVKLIEYAKIVGLDVNRFGGCLINNKLNEKIQASHQQAQQDKVQVAPTFLVNGKKFVGPVSFDDLSRAIDEILKGEKSS